MPARPLPSPSSRATTRPTRAPPPRLGASHPSWRYSKVRARLANHADGLCAPALHASAHHSAPLRVSWFEGDGAESAKKAAASALWSFSANHAQNQAAIAEAGGLAPLVALLGVGGAETQLQAAGALAAIALDNPQNQNTIATMLVQLLTAPDTPTRTKAARAISNLARAHTSNQEALAK